MKNFRFRIQVVFIALLLGFVSMSAQNIRYVKMASAGGDNANNGLSWANAKADIQDAINDLVNNNLVGEVRVMAGTYKPTETTEASTNVQFKAFKIPAGITVRGGYSASGETMSGETILSGNLTGNEATFTFSNGKYNTSFYGNSYHVVWFAMNGFENDRAKALAKAARLENCTVEGGHAYNTSISGRSHTAYGGGIYMVANSYVTNCIVRKCDASRDGGGIYMDGGGEVRHTTVTKCQALGISIDYGFGGGICAEGNNSPYYAIVTQSKINSCVGRMGGGMALLAIGGSHKYQVVSNSTLINNNTATTEAGGVYMENGGGLANMTITRNKCNGTGVNANGVEFGRAAGVFCHDCGNIGNSVIWGNERNGSPVQLVAERSANRDDLKTKVRYCALSDIDNTDWSSTIKQGLKSLNSDNSGATSGNKGNALFNNPTTEAGVLEAYTDVDNKKASYAENEYCWNIDSHSAFRHAGIYTIDLDHEGETPAPETSRDLVDNQYNPRTTLGAYSVQGYAVYPKITGAKAEFFIDPNFLFSSTPVTDQTGQSWDNPGRFLANAFEYIKAHKSSDLSGKEIIVYVKQGTINNTNSNATGRVRLSSIDIPAGVKVYGGYAADLTGTNLSKRNPIKYPSVITGEVTEGEYDYNVAHLITINKDNVTLDGFKITLANAYSTLLTSTSQDGAAITIKGATGVTLKNIIVSNCQAAHGAAVYADGATASFENCIFHNNTTTTLANSGLIYGINNSNLSFSHCNVLRSVGHASYLDATTKNEWTNSMFYGNLDRAQDNTNNTAQYAIIAFAGPGANNTNLTGGNNMFDTVTKGKFDIAANIPGADIYNANGLNYTYQSGTANGYPRMVNPTKNAGISPQGDITYYGRSTSFEPHNDNPVVNAASATDAHTTWGTDITTVVTRDFGGIPDIGAIESHLATVAEEGENANTDGQPVYGTVMYVRDYASTGTDVDTYDKDGSGTLTKNADNKGTYNAAGEFLDGASWARAINGNATYDYVPGTISTTERINTFIEAKNEAVPGKSGFRINMGGAYLKVNDAKTGLTTTTAANDATLWNVSASTTSAPMESFSTGERYFWIEDNNGTKYYLNLQVTRSGNNRNRVYSGTLSVAITTDNANFDVTSGYKLRRSYDNNKTNWVYIRYANNTLAASATNDNNSWTVTKYSEDPSAPQYVEKPVDAKATLVGSHKAGDRISDYRNLHVYNAMANVTTASDAGKLVTFKLAQLGYKDVPENTETGTPAHKEDADATNDVTGDFVLINAGPATRNDLVYIYDKTSHKFISISDENVVFAEDASKTAWRIKASTNSGRLSIIPATTADNEIVNDTKALQWASATTFALNPRSEDAAQWVMVANNDYDDYNVSITTTGGKIQINGLQYAANTVHDNLKLVARTERVTERYSASSTKEVTHTLYDLPGDTKDGQVWVGAGLYTNTAGWEIRNHVIVYGGFPKKGNPAMNERHPQLSTGIAMSKENTAAHLNVADFETILQTNSAKPTATTNNTYNINVLRQPRECQVTQADDSNVPQDRVVYEGAMWDGFTIRYGYKYGVTGSGGGRRWSGAGVGLYENVTLRNCIVRDNYLASNPSSSTRGRGAGIYCDGSTIENCYILDNESACDQENFGGGIYMIQGTMFNSVIAGNKCSNSSYNEGAGIFIESAKFYNNTIVNNTGAPAIGVYTASKASADLVVYNTIVIAGTGQDILWRASGTTPTVFVNCYLKTDKTDNAISSALTNSSSVVVLQDDVTTDYATYARKRENKVFMTDDVTALGGVSYKKISSLADENPFAADWATATSTHDYRISQMMDGGAVAAKNCVNAATEDFQYKTDVASTIELPDNDMDYTERIQDCRLDIGAYEYNGATNIHPHVVDNVAIYYVTPDGYGSTDAHDPENAACAAKLQKVIDAAGRYKYSNPNKQVIVKVANSHSLKEANSDFEYYATRTTDPSSTDTRMWSIIIPRGVEVWGGYTDVAPSDKTKNSWSNTNNGFYTGTYTAPVDARSILDNPTYFASYFYNRNMKINAVAYHVVTFTDRVYDLDGKPYLAGDDINGASSFTSSSNLTDTDYMRMTDVLATQANANPNVQAEVVVDGHKISSRGVLDGIFVTGGKADGVTNGGNLNINGYGGAAIVNEYAHVRNCILTGNSANNGGALALKDMGIVSGCLIVENTAQNGGGIYVFENGAKLSDGTTVNTAQGSGPVMDWRMPHVFTSTIANNKATNQGAGVWFNNSDDPNVRINSSVIWKNETNNDPNIAGNIFPEKPLNNSLSTDEYYPLAYTAVEGQRASGANNRSVNSDNLKGTRFATAATDHIGDIHVIAEKVSDLSFYGLTSYSILNNTGMPKRFYESMLNSMAVSPTDYAGVNRTTSGESTRAYIEIGARAFGKTYPENGLMLRLYVAQPEDVNMTAAQAMMALESKAGATAEELYYSQEGSSSAYPFQSLQEALDYIYKYRSATQMSNDNNKKLIDKYHANKLPFEIVMSQGVYYPTRDLAEKYGRSLANTFPVPEAVSIYGSFAAPDEAGAFYGAGYKAKASFDTEPDSPSASYPYFITKNIESIGSETTSVADISLNQYSKAKLLNVRVQQDNNANGIIEPWEFRDQTILSGNSINTNNAGVYHVVTAVADQNVVGVLPWISVKHDDADAANCDGLHDHEEGQTIHLNGLQITGGNAYMYDEQSLDKYGSYIYYQGGGLQVDGNRYNDDYNKNTTSETTFDEKHRISYGVGYRDIPLSIANCRFLNNRAGYGGAISSNGTLDIFSSSFEANLAIARTDKGVSNEDHSGINVMYPGEGGAILATHQLSCFNTVFANNEARFDAGETVTDQPQKHTTFRMPDANVLKPILRAAGGAIMMGTAAQHHIVNCDFVRNKAMAYPAVFTMNPTAEPANQDAITTPEYSQILNSVAWGNEIDATVASKYYSAKFMCNVGPKTRPVDYSAATLLTADKSTLESSYQEAVWFSAYEKGVSFAAHNEKDARDLAYSPIGFAAKQITTAVGTYQNCNIEISSENETLEGPNFGNPSLKAGIDGFMASADWSPARINRLTDAGSGVLKLNADRTGFDMESSENTGAYVVTHFIPQFPEYKENLPLGTERYMNRASNGEDLYRIALDPDKKSDKAYIDMGVYEYRYATLKPSASEVDLLWVATRERGEADGSTWDNATSDLQRAIETLLESRNGHKKEIHIMEGEYSPTKTYTASDSKQYQAFYIDTKQLNGSVEHAPGWQEDTDKSKYYAQSLTIKGGYSNDLKYQYDPKEYPTVIRQQASTSGAKTDYLIYIADPTQRYDLSDYTGTDDGAKPSSESIENTMPIQIDGVTLINDQAPANTKGSAIYYPDVAEAITSPTAVNVNPTVTYYLDAEMQNPAAPGVVTDFFSTRTYYTDAEKQNPSTGNAKTSNYKETGEQKNDPAKLVLTKTLVVGSGKSGDTTGSAVYIGKNGGSALIYNTVFHSNYGMPLDAYNTVNVNNTFAKNGGLVQLNDQSAVTVKSQMFNSALWLNNSKGEQFSIPNVTVTEGNTGKPTNFAYNAFTGGNTTATDYTVADGTVAGNNYNTGLVEDNSNILNGPNFVNPGNDADNTVEAFMLRNFDIKPSLRLFNRGMDTSIESGDGHYFKNVVENKYDFSLASTTDVDVINRPRLAGSAIDRGAYEYQGSLKQYLYVDPNKTGDKTDKAGDDWTTPLGYGDIQNAMDLAGLYHANNPEQNGYVFVKGNSSTNKGENTNETITIRDGVTTYGSILSSYTDWHDIKDPNDPSKNKYNNVDDFIRDIRLNREGVASTHANQTIVTGIKTSDATAFNGDNGNTPAIIDGFVVTDPNGPTAPVLDITNESKDATIVVRNIIVADNDMSKAEGNVNVAQISNGLIYEALFRDNKPKDEGAVLNVSNTEKTKGYAVNVTVEGKTVGADGSTPVDGDNESGSQIYKSITNSIDGSQDGAYGKILNKGIFGYYYNIGRIGDTNKSTNADLNYQLSETSKYIDMCEAVNPFAGVADNLAQFINYQTDRDILGNPRLLAGVTTESKIDRGAFETWKVENDWHTGHDNSIAKQSGYESTTAGTYEDDIKYTFYPHAGSAVYLMEDKYIVLDAPGAGYDETTSNPGFLLVKEGANLYTNGRHTTVAYVAVERKVKEDGSILALPYAMKYGKNVTIVDADGSDLKLTPTTGSTSLYSGTDRMDWKYVFQKENTKCWKGVAENVAVDACNGVLYEPNKGITFDADNEVLLRFTAQGTVINDYIYEEYGPTKEVTLTKHDDAESTNNGADYTDELDMSWNCFGIPYLVSEYKPYEKATAYSASDKYMMNIPHTLWLYYDGMVGPDGEPVNGDGGYYSVKSWTSEAADWHVTTDAAKSLWVGEGIFTQTATLDDSESLVFYRPVTPTLGGSESPAKGVRYYFDGTGIEETEDVTGVELVDTEYYTTDGARISRPHRGAIVIVKQVYSDGNIKTSKQYVK